MKDYTDEYRKQEIKSAKAEITQIEAAMLLATNNTLGCEIHIAGLKIGICDNKKILPALKHHKREIEKFIAGESNMYE
jgi:hypothetical protein